MLTPSETPTNNIIIAIYNEKAIAINEYGSISISTSPTEFITLGESVPADSLTPLSSLPEAEQNKIKNYISECL